MKRGPASPAERRRIRGEVRANLKSELDGKRAQLRQDVREKLRTRKERRGAPKKRWRPSRWWLLVAALIVLLLFLRDCRCSPLPEPPEAASQPGEAVTPPPSEAPEPPALAVAKRPKIARQARPRLQAPPPEPPTWIDVFRLQVSARSPRLAACFEGVHHPGTLKWTTSVEPGQGAVSEHTLEPMLDTAQLGVTERECILEVLEKPSYTLPADSAPATPRRVGLVIEF